MKNSLSKRIFWVCLICLLACILVFNAVILVFSTRFFQNDRYNMMQRNAAIAANITANNYIMNDYKGIDEKTLFATFGVLSTTIGADFLLVHNTGAVIYHTGATRPDLEYTVPEEILLQAQEKGYSATQKVEGLTEEISYIVGVPVKVDDKVVSTVFVVASAKDMSSFLGESSKTMLITSIIVLFICLIIISAITSRMFNPLKQMVDATNSFAKGDFTKRIPVSRQDEIGQLAMSFNKMASTLASTETTRRTFIANVSHELKTPMTTIGGFVDGMLDGTIAYEQQDQYLKIVSSEVKRLTRLVHSMLDTARIDAGEMIIEPTTFDISEIIRQSIFNFEQKVEEKNIIISGLETDKKMVFADRDLIYQVVYNLLENAVKFVAVDGEISVRYEVKGENLYTTIRNTGEGIPKEEIEQIFEQFFKSDRSRAENTNGVGLGLHIVKSIITYHKGEITANSVLGEYTEFTFGIKAAPNTLKSGK